MGSAYSGRSIGMNDVKGDMLVNKRCTEYFGGLLNMNDNREAFLSVVGNGSGMPDVKGVIMK